MKPFALKHFTSAILVGLLWVANVPNSVALTPSEVAKLTANDPSVADVFGWSVAVSGDTAVIGALGDDDDATESGSAYVFRR